jgi:sugar O-acyltransferase (sialic acid O-acetyltransferase NeuD family)
MKRIAIFGYSGFAKEVADICFALNYNEIVFLSAFGSIGDVINGIIVKAESEAYQLHENGFDFVIGIGDSALRSKIAQAYREFNFPTLIHPDCSFGIYQLEQIINKKGSIICAGCRLTNNIILGDFCILNLNTTVGHDSIIGDYVSIMPGVNISGNVEVGDGVFIGTGAAIIQGRVGEKLRVGDKTVVGAATLITKSVPMDVTVVGVPFKVISK